MSEATRYNKYEVQTLLKLTKHDEYKMERLFDVYKQDGGKHFYYNILNTLSFTDKIDRNSYTVHICRAEELWTTISYKNYDRIDLWWIIAAINKINNTFEPPAPGTKLMVPTPAAIRMIIDEIKSKR